MKNYFSSDSDQYARYRPQYPLDLIKYIMELVKYRNFAWDCATGSGQLASQLSNFFHTVEATDISDEQMKQAYKAKNIHYSKQAAESTGLSENYFDLITVGQAVHWFDFEEFYIEVDRVLKPQGILALIGYDLLRSTKETNKIVDHFYKNIIGSCWDEERKYLDEKYKTIPFPLQEISAPYFEIKLNWKYEHLIGYFRTWSAVKHFQKKNGYDPVNLIAGDLKKSFGKEGEIKFPLLLRIGRKI